MDDNDLVLWESRVILTYLVSMYAKDDTLYPKDIKTRALVDQRLHFDLGTLYQRTLDYFVSDLKCNFWMREKEVGKDWNNFQIFKSAEFAQLFAKLRKYLLKEKF